MKCRLQCLSLLALTALSACSSSRVPTREEAIAESLRVSPGAIRRMQAEGSLGLDTISAFTPAEARLVLRELRLRPDLPRLRAAFRNLPLKTAEGSVTSDAMWNAIQRFDQLRSLGASAFGGAAGLRPPPVASRNWISLGPHNVGGRTRSILIDPADPRHLWVGSVGGGIWESRDGGATLVPVDDFMATLAICCLAIDPTDPTTIYAGTGEGFYNEDQIRGAGVFRADRASGGRFKPVAGSNKDGLQYMTRIAVSADGRVVYAAAPHDGSNNPAGVFRFERGRPATSQWDRVLTAVVMDVQAHPTDPARAIAGGYGLQGGQAWFTENGGKAWLPAGPADTWAGRVELRYARSNPQIVYALVDSNGGEVWMSADGGRTYQPKATTLSDASATILGAQGSYANVIWVDPTNPNVLVAGGLDLWRSTDSGEHFARISTWRDSTSVHADQHAIVAHPQYNGTSNTTVYVGNDGGLYMTPNILTAGTQAPHSAGWQSLNQTYATTQFYRGVVGKSGAIVAGAQDLGTLHLGSSAGPRDWTVASDGDGAWTAAHPSNSEVFIGEYIYLDLVRLVPHKNVVEELTGIATWDEDGRPVWKDDRYVLGDARTILGRTAPSPETETANFLAPFVLDADNPSIVYAGGASVWRTMDLHVEVTATTGPTWTPIREELAPQGRERLVSAMSLRPGNSSILWIGYNNGRLYRTNNARAPKPDWVEIDGGPQHRLPRGRVVTRIVFDPATPETVYVTYGGFASPNIWKSTNGGASWTSIHARLPAMPVFTVAVHPQDSRSLYLASEFGVFTSKNGGTSWVNENKGPANCSVQDLFWSGPVLYAATHGRGLFKVDLSAQR